MINLEKGKTYNFNTRSASIAPGVQVVNARYEGEISYAVASKLFDVDVKYRNYYPLLPPGTLNDMKNRTYYVFTASNGSALYFCDQWIDGNSVVEISGNSFTILFQNAASDTKNNVVNMLTAAGFTNFTVSE